MYQCLKCSTYFDVMETGIIHLATCNPNGFVQMPPQSLAFTDEWEKSDCNMNE